MAADQRHGTAEFRALVTAAAALAVAGGIVAALANFVPWWVAAGLGALSGGAGMYGGVLWQRHADRLTREAAWRKVTNAGPYGADEDRLGDDGVLELLDPGRALVPYSPSHEPLAQRVVRWVHGGGDVAEQVLYVDGTPGSGKTRLLVEVADRVSARCGWVIPGCGAESVTAAAGLDQPTVLIFDDAETRGDVDAALAAWSALDRPQVRVVLVGRSNDAWWPMLRGRLAGVDLSRLPYRPQITVASITGDGKSQQQRFERALRHFTAESELVPAARWEPVDRPPSILLLHAGAALAARTRASEVIRADSVVEQLFAAERERWLDAAGRAGLDGLPTEVFGPAVVLAAVVGARDEQHARTVLGHLPSLAADSRKDQLADRIADWLRGLYAQQQPDWLAPRLPALLLERYAAAAIADSPALAGAVAAATEDDHREQRVIVFLARAAAHSDQALAAVAALIRHEPGRMIPAAISVASRISAPLDPVVVAGLAEAGHQFGAAQLVKLGETIPESARMLLLAGTAVALLRMYLSHPDVDPDDSDALTTRQRLADVLRELGRYGDAESEFREVVSARTRLLGADHLDTQAARHRLGDVLHELGRYGDAESEFREVLAAQTRLLGAEHPSTLATRNCLADVLRELGRYGDAESEFREVVSARTRLLGAEHLDTLTARHNLAAVLHQLGRHGDAESDLREVVSARTRLLGAEHPSTLTARHNLAAVLNKLGRLRDAETECREVLAAETRLLGAEHPDTLGTRRNLAIVLQELGCYREAESELQEVVAARTRLLGAEHPDTLATRNNLASVLRELGRYGDAETEYRQVLAAQTRLLGAEHPDTLATRHNLAIVLLELGRHDDAESEFREVLAAETRLLGADHPSTLTTRHNLAIVLRMLGREVEALSFLAGRAGRPTTMGN